MTHHQEYQNQEQYNSKIKRINIEEDGLHKCARVITNFLTTMQSRTNQDKNQVELSTSRLASTSLHNGLQ